MHLIQFQKLQELIGKTKDYIIQLKFDKNKLHKEKSKTRFDYLIAPDVR